MAINFWIKNILFPNQNLRIFKISHIFSKFFNPGSDQKMGSNSKNGNRGAINFI